MKPVMHKAKNFQEAHQWDIEQQLSLSSEERQAAADELKRRFYGENVSDIREGQKRK